MIFLASLLHLAVGYQYAATVKTLDFVNACSCLKFFFLITITACDISSNCDFGNKIFTEIFQYSQIWKLEYLFISNFVFFQYHLPVSFTMEKLTPSFELKFPLEYLFINKVEHWCHVEKCDLFIWHSVKVSSGL